MKVKIQIYNMYGQKIENLLEERKLKGKYSIDWHAGSNASGIYLVKMTTEKYITTKKIVLLK